MAGKLFDLTDRVAVVTGGYGILGGAIADGLMEAGASVVIVGRNRSAADTQANELRSRHPGKADAIGAVADVIDPDSLKIARNEILHSLGKIDILVNAAGGNIARARTDNRPVFELPFDAYDEIVRLNLHGSVYPTLVFGESMAKSGSGSVVNISSMASLQAISGVLGYSNAKAAIDNFTKWMAVDLAFRYGDRIRVNAIAPGFFITKQNQNVLVSPTGEYTERSRKILARTPAGRFGRPEELVGTAVWLCSEASSFVTGTIIPVDGGFSVYSGV